MAVMLDLNTTAALAATRRQGASCTVSSGSPRTLMLEIVKGLCVSRARAGAPGKVEPRLDDGLFDGPRGHIHVGPLAHDGGPEAAARIDEESIWSLHADRLERRFRGLSSDGRGGIHAVEPTEPGLSRRELEILQLVAEGHPNCQIARRLWITEKTVKFHLTRVYRKLGVANRTEASRRALQDGLVVDEPPDEGASVTTAGRAASTWLAQVDRRRAGELTSREREILQLVAEGYSNSVVAWLLRVREPTVKCHLSNIYRKLAVANRTEASRWALRNGLLPAPGPADLQAA